MISLNNESLVTYHETIDYPYTLRNLGRAIETNKSALEAIRSESVGVTLKEAFTSNEIDPYVQQIFADEIIKLGLASAKSRQLFQTRTQPTHHNFTQRYKYKNARGWQILRELEQIKSSKHGMFKITYGFCKLACENLFSYERLMDSPIEDSVDDAVFNANQAARLEDWLAWDQLCRFTASPSNIWTNWIEGPTLSDDFFENAEDPYHINNSLAYDLFRAMTTAYNYMTSRIVDRFDPDGLVWLFSSQAFTILWYFTLWQTYWTAGQKPVGLTGQLPAPLGLPYYIVEPGYFKAGTTQSEWTPCASDIYLINTNQAMKWRDRVSMRMENFNREQIQASGTIMWERTAPYILNPLAMIRISPNQSYADQVSPIDWTQQDVTIHNENITLKVE